MKNTSLLADLVQAVICAQSKDFDSTVDELFTTLNDAFLQTVREVSVDAVKLVKQYRGDISDLTGELKGLFQQAFAVDYPAKVRRPTKELLEASYLHGATSAMESAAFAKAPKQPEVVAPAIKFGRADQKALATLQGEAMFWIGEHYGDKIEDDLEKELGKYFTDGMTREDLSWGIEETMVRVAKRSRAYWNFFADHTATKMREIGRISGYNQAGIEIVRVQAWIDDRTTEICRALNGTVISVKQLEAFRDTYLEASKSRDKEAIKAAWPWLSAAEGKKLNDPAKKEKALVDGTIGLPPYHARCRTITVAEFKEASSMDTVAPKPVAKPAPKIAPKPAIPIEATTIQGAVDSAKKVVAGFRPKATEIERMIADAKSAEKALIEEFCDVAKVGYFKDKNLLRQVGEVRAKITQAKKTVAAAERKWTVFNNKRSKEIWSAVQQTGNKATFENDVLTYSLSHYSNGVAPRSKMRKTFSKSVAWFEDMLEWNPGAKLTLAKCRGRRAYFSTADNCLCVAPSDGANIIVHEAGHFLESHNPALAKKAIAYRESRTAGEKTVRLMDLFPKRGYRRDEVTKKDTFLSPYIGKEYEHGATEVTSMALQYLYEDPAMLLEKDESFFRYALEVLRGEF